MTAALIVTGASGHLGRLVIDQLREIHPGPIIATTRDPSRISNIPGVIAREADFDRPDTLLSAFEGGERLLLISTDAVGADGRRVRQHQAAIDAARRAGLNHVVYTSLTNPAPPAVITIAPDHYATEQALAESGLGWTSLRDNLYADLLVQFLASALRSGVWEAAAGDGAVGWVAREDCARTAAYTLAQPPPKSGVVDVTGPALTSYAEIAEIATRVTGRSVVYRAVDEPAAAANLSHAPLPPHVQQLLLSFQLAAARGDLAVVSDTVQRVTGRVPMGVAAFLEANLVSDS